MTVSSKSNKGKRQKIRLLAGILGMSFAALAASQALAGDTTYKYDALGRIIEVNYPDGTKITYAYDAAGNRTQVVKTPGP